MANEYLQRTLLIAFIRGSLEQTENLPKKLLFRNKKTDNQILKKENDLNKNQNMIR